jgi:hypothetical protein
MAELNHMEDPLPPADLAGTIDRFTNRTPLQDWVERPAIPPADATPNVAGDRVEQDIGLTPLFSDAEIGDLRSRWGNIQAEFVDEPRRSVREADQLVASAMQRLAEGFANERASLEKQWGTGDNVSTEDLRLALQRYRAFFGRLLNAA